MTREEEADRQLDMLLRHGSTAAMDELRDCAREVLTLHPGCDRPEWTHILVSQYGTEVVDALGPDPTAARDMLEELWREVTGDD